MGTSEAKMLTYLALAETSGFPAVEVQPWLRLIGGLIFVTYLVAVYRWVRSRLPSGPVAMLEKYVLCFGTICGIGLVAYVGGLTRQFNGCERDWRPSRNRSGA